MNVMASIRSLYFRLTSFFTGNLTRSAIALFGFISLVAVFGGTYDFVSMLKQKSEALANEMQKDKDNTLLLELIRSKNQIRTDVFQVVQSLLVYSATRAQDGHDNGLQEAAEYAERFRQDIGAAKTTAEALDGENFIKALTLVAQLFPDYYSRGVEMAKIYAAEGPFAGNKLIAQFRAQSEEMQKRLDELESAKETLKSRIAASLALADKRIRDSSENQTSIALSGVLATALTCLAGVFLAYYRVTQPLSWITHCFKCLENNQLHLEVNETSRTDEIGALSRTYGEFKQLALERRKNGLGAALLTQFNEWLHCCKSLDELYEVVAKYLALLLPNCAGTLYIFSNSRDVLNNVKAWSGAAMAPPIHPDDCWGLRRGRVFSHWQDDIDFHCGHVNSSTPSDYCCIPITAHGETIGLLHLVFSTYPGPRLEKTLDEQRNLALNCAEQVSIAIANVKLRDQLHDQSIRDALTGLYNRRYFLEACRRELARAARTAQYVSLLSIDVDHFKKFNDRHGHDAGDMVLRAVAECLEKNFRDQDVPCRFGGEEFIVLLPGLAPTEAVQRANKLCNEMESLVIHYLDRILPRITISVGIAAFPHCGENPPAVIKAADEALYAAKENGRNRVEASTLLGLSSEVLTARSKLKQKALEEEFAMQSLSNEAA
jgi:diguanylate cyclase (GGDEF)-like protein